MESKAIPFTRGIVRNPSELLAQDGELAECINLISENSELKAVQEPKFRFRLQDNEKLLYVHTNSTYKNYIVTGPDPGINTESEVSAQSDDEETQLKKNQFALVYEDDRYTVTFKSRFAITSDMELSFYYKFGEAYVEDTVTVEAGLAEKVVWSVPKDQKDIYDEGVWDMRYFMPKYDDTTYMEYLGIYNWNETIDFDTEDTYKAKSEVDGSAYSDDTDVDEKYEVEPTPDTWLYWFTDGDSERTYMTGVCGNVQEVQSVGNTLIVITDKGMNYILFKDRSYYKNLGTHLPDVKVEFTSDCFFNQDGSLVSNTVGANRYRHGMIEHRSRNISVSRTFRNSAGNDALDMDNEDDKGLSDSVMAQAVKQMNRSMHDGCFHQPTLVRFALRLYDGTYTMYSSPFLAFGRGFSDGNASDGSKEFTLESYSYYLDYFIRSSQLEKLKEWKDIVHGITFFASEEIYSVDINANVPYVNCDGSWNTIPLPKVSQTLQNRRITDTSAFYKLYDINTEEYKSGYLFVYLTYPDDVPGAGTISLTYRKTMTSDTEVLFSVDVAKGENLDTICDRIIDEVEEKGWRGYKQFCSYGCKGTDSFDYCAGMAFIPNSEEDFVKMAVVSVDSSQTKNAYRGYVYKFYGTPMVTSRIPASTLATQESISDDYFTHNHFTAGNSLVYNNRLILSDITRLTYSPVYNGLVSTNYGQYVDKIWYCLKIDGDEVVIQQDVNKSICLNYLYYPDSRCYKAIVKVLADDKSSYKYYRFLMVGEYNRTSETTQLLQGSCCLVGIPKYMSVINTGGEWKTNTWIHLNDEFALDGTITSDPVATEGYSEYMPNLVMRSEANNPYVFTVYGYTRVGNGQIRKLSTNTTALSQGQFGQHPVFAFSSDGVWAISVSDTGTFSSKMPVSRDVCSNVGSVCQIDNGVVFATQNGLKAILSDGGTGASMKDLSEGMDGRNFSDSLKNIGTTSETYSSLISYAKDAESFVTYIQNAFISYDYSDGRIIISDPAKTYQYAMSLTSGQFSKISRNGRMYIYQANDYPSQLLIDSSLNVYDLYGKDDVNTVTGNTDGIAVTRPLSFGSSTTRKAIMKMKVLKSFSEGSTLAIKVWGSDDLINWYEKRSMLGSSYQYYIVAVYVSMLPVDSIPGIITMIQTRMDNKLR